MILVDALIPAFNEAATIEAVVRGIRPLVRAVTVVDDGSTDGTGVRARDAGAVVIERSINGGKGAAIRMGLTTILAGPCSHVLLMDGDLQHLPEEAGRLIETAERTGADLVIGERQFDRAAMPAARYYANWIGSAILSRFVGTTVRDTQCGFRLFAKGILGDLTLVGNGYEIETEMLVKVTAARRTDCVRAGQRGLRSRRQQAASGSRHHAHLLPRECTYRFLEPR